MNINDIDPKEIKVVENYSKPISPEEMRVLETYENKNEQRNPMSPAASGAMGAVEGATFGLSDELAGALLGESGSLKGALKEAGKFVGIEPNRLDPDVKAYILERDKQRALQEQAALDNPISHKLSEIGGGIGTSSLAGIGSTARAAATKLSPTEITSLLDRVRALGVGSASGMAEGAQIGSLYGLGQSKSNTQEGLIGDISESAKSGAEMGGIVGTLGSIPEALSGVELQSPSLKRMQYSLKEGLKGEKISSPEVKKEKQDKFIESVKDLYSKVEGQLDQLGKEKKATLSSTQQEPMTLAESVDSFLDKIDNAVKDKRITKEDAKVLYDSAREAKFDTNSGDISKYTKEKLDNLVRMLREGYVDSPLKPTAQKMLKDFTDEQAQKLGEDVLDLNKKITTRSSILDTLGRRENIRGTEEPLKNIPAEALNTLSQTGLSETSIPTTSKLNDLLKLVENADKQKVKSDVDSKTIKELLDQIKKTSFEESVSSGEGGSIFGTTPKSLTSSIKNNLNEASNYAGLIAKQAKKLKPGMGLEVAASLNNESPDEYERVLDLIKDKNDTGHMVLKEQLNALKSMEPEKRAAAQFSLSQNPIFRKVKDQLNK